MPSPDLAIKNLQKMLQKEPVLRDLLDPSLPRTRGGRFHPDLDVIETEAGWTILLDVPGLSRDALALSVEGTKLVVRGSRPAGHPAGKVRRAERSVGTFEREFLLPSAADPGSVSAKLVDGVLTVLVPRAGGKTKKVEISEG